MVPSVEQIVCYRYIAKAVLRVSGVLMVSWSIFPIASWLSEGLRDGDLFWISYYATRIGSGCGSMFFGMIFLLGAGPVSKLLLPFPKLRCPRCSYSLEFHTRAYCPECGLLLPPAVIEPYEASQVQLPGPAHPPTSPPCPPASAPPAQSQSAPTAPPAPPQQF